MCRLQFHQAERKIGDLESELALWSKTASLSTTRTGGAPVLSEKLDAANTEIEYLKNKLAETRQPRLSPPQKLSASSVTSGDDLTGVSQLQSQLNSSALEIQFLKDKLKTQQLPTASPAQKLPDVSDLQSKLASSALEIQYLKDKMEIMQQRVQQPRASPPSKLQDDGNVDRKAPGGGAQNIVTVSPAVMAELCDLPFLKLKRRVVALGLPKALIDDCEGKSDLLQYVVTSEQQQASGVMAELPLPSELQDNNEQLRQEKEKLLEKQEDLMIDNRALMDEMKSKEQQARTDALTLSDAQVSLKQQERELTRLNLEISDLKKEIEEAADENIYLSEQADRFEQQSSKQQKEEAGECLRKDALTNLVRFV